MLIITLVAASALAQAYGNTPSAKATAAAPAPAAASAPAAPVMTVAVPGRTLKDLPDTSVIHYPVPGRKMPEIQQSLKALLADPANKERLRLYNWSIGTQFTKRTTGPTCVVTNAKLTLTAKVNIPRLAEPTKVKKQVLADWTSYVTNVENDAAASLWFLHDRIRGADQALVGQPCDKASGIWNAKLEAVQSELTAFVAQRALAASRPAG